MSCGRMAPANCHGDWPPLASEINGSNGDRSGGITNLPVNVIRIRKKSSRPGPHLTLWPVWDVSKGVVISSTIFGAGIIPEVPLSMGMAREELSQFVWTAREGNGVCGALQLRVYMKYRRLSGKLWHWRSISLHTKVPPRAEDCTSQK